MDAPSRIVAIGGSAGALEPLLSLLGQLPPDLDMAYLVVIHFPADRTSLLPELINRATQLHASYASDGDRLVAGRVYVARSDRHLVVVDGRVGVINGPKENASRPSIDVLFRSVAQAAGPRAVGVVLSGSLDDGSAGLLAIAKRGGHAFVQDPREALFSEMPRNAAAIGEAKVLSVADIAASLIGMDRDRQLEHAAMNDLPKQAERDRNGMPEDEPFANPSPFVCPECDGTLWQLRDGALERYRCRVGHAYSEQTLFEQKGESLEAALWAALRALKEQTDLSKRIADTARSRENASMAARYEEKRRAAEAAQDTVREVLLSLRPSEDPGTDAQVARQSGGSGTGSPRTGR